MSGDCFVSLNDKFMQPSLRGTKQSKYQTITS